MRISGLCLLSLLLFHSSAGADDIRDASRLLRASNVENQFELMTQQQTRRIIRTYSSIVSMSAELELPQWIKLEIASCYERAFAWDKFEEGIVDIFLENFSSDEMHLLTDFYNSEGLPPTEIENFKVAIAKGELIQQLTSEYIYSNSEGCAQHDIDLILSFLQNPQLEFDSTLAAE